MLQKTRCINYELPYSERLYYMARKKLTSLGFTVHHQGSGELLVAANEYVFSKCDLLVYHPGKCEMHVQALHISVRQIDVLCISDDYQINKYDLSQAVAELKVENTTAETEKECFFNCLWYCSCSPSP